MRAILIPATMFAWLAAAVVLIAGQPSTISQPELKGEAILVWGTNDSSPPAGKDYHPVDPEMLKKLKDLPLKWSHWFEVRRKSFTAPVGLMKQVVMSEKCQLNVKNLGADSELEVSVIGKGKEVVRRKQALPKGEMLVLGGNAPNDTAWLVILKRTE